MVKCSVWNGYYVTITTIAPQQIVAGSPRVPGPVCNTVMT